MQITSTRTALLAMAVALSLASGAAAERADDTDRKSKNGRTTGTIDGIEVTLEYGRPNVKGRTIWGGLVPYGKVWRTGADEATTVSFSADVLVEGERLAAGTYALFTIPGEDEWAVVFNSVSDQWGAFNHDASKDVLEVMSWPQENEHVESMDFVIEGSSVVLRWAELAVPFSIAAAN